MTILFAGESWFKYETHVKGIDSFSQVYYEEEISNIKSALESAGMNFVHIPSHMVPNTFPSTVEELLKYSAVFISDVGANSLFLSDATSIHSNIMPDRFAAIEEYVRCGGGFCMIGGYMSFSGIEGKANYKGTLIEQLLPVTLMATDDRCEVPSGANISIVQPTHPVFGGIDERWPSFLGYNKLQAKDGAILASHNGNAFISRLGLRERTITGVCQRLRAALGAT